jgi:hypothetical protein
METWVKNLNDYPFNYDELLETYNKEKDNLVATEKRRERKKKFYGK